MYGIAHRRNITEEKRPTRREATQNIFKLHFRRRNSTVPFILQLYILLELKWCRKKTKRYENSQSSEPFQPRQRRRSDKQDPVELAFQPRKVFRGDPDPSCAVSPFVRPRVGLDFRFAVLSFCIVVILRSDWYWPEARRS